MPLLHWTDLKPDLPPEQQTRLLQAWQQIQAQIEDQAPVSPQAWHAFDEVLTEAAAQIAPLQAILQQLQSGNTHYALRIIHDDPQVLNLPWMRAKLGPQGEALVDLKRLYLSICPAAFIQNGPDALPQLAPGPLKLLIMIANPVDMDAGDRLDFEEEEEELLKAFLPLLEQGRVEIDFTENGSLEALRRKLKENEYHILHFSGHGSYHKGKGYLLLEDDLNLKQQSVPAKEFAEALISVPGRQIPLVLLSACQTATAGIPIKAASPDEAEKTGQDTELHGTTMELLNKGTPAVIAMNASISDPHARAFSTAFYQELANATPLAPTVPQAFQTARLKVRTQEYQEQQQHGRFPLQWTIPRLYLSKNLEQPVAWEAAATALSYPHLKTAFRIHDKVERPEGDQYRFIGRRQEMGKVMEPFSKMEPVLLTGQGGVGKSAMAEHLVNRLRWREPTVREIVITEISNTTLPEILDELMALAAEILKRQELKALKKDIEDEKDLIEKVAWILEALNPHCKPLFLFDNLETFLTPDLQAFKEENQDLAQLLSWLLSPPAKVYLLLTSRYPLPNLEINANRDLNQASFNDFLKKCTRLSFSKLQEELRQALLAALEKEPSAKLPGFQQLIRLLYKTLGGNYFYVERFDKVYQESRARFAEAMLELQRFQQEIEASKSEKLQEMSQKLSFQTLLNLCETQELETLWLLSQFNLPAQQTALIAQGLDTSLLSKSLKRLVTLTLSEASTFHYPNKTLTFYYVTPLIRDLLHKTDRTPTAPFNPTLAGNYYFHHYTNLDGDLTHLETAHNYFLASKSEAGLQQTGGRLTYIYRALHDYQQAYRFGLQTYEILGDKADFDLLNWLGLTAHTLGKLALALECYEKAQKLAEADQNKKQLGTTFNNISGIHKARGEYDKALTFLKQSRIISQDIGDKSGEGATLNNISQIYDARGEFDMALTFLNKALNIQQEIGDKKQEGATLNNISQIHSARGEYDKALTFLNKALNIRKEIGDKSGEGTTLNNISQIYHTRGEYDKALTFLNKALNIQQEIGDKNGEGTTLNNISQIYDARGKYDKALTFLNKALNIFQETGDKKQESATLNNISQIHNARGEYDKALTFLNKALNIQQEIGDKNGEGTTLNNISQIYHARGEYDKALTLLNKVLNIQQEIGNKKQEGTTLNNISQIYHARGEYDKALTFLNKALNIFQETGDKKHEGTTLNNIAGLHIERDEYDKALTFLNKALNIQQEIGDKSGEGTTLNNLATIAHARGEYDKALTFLKQSRIISQEIGDLSGQAITLHNMALIYLENKNDPKKFIQLESEAFQIAVQIGNTNAIYKIGKALGIFLFQIGATEPAHEVLTLTLQAGEQGQYPDLPQFKADLKEIGYLK